MQLATIRHAQNAQNVTTYSLGFMPAPQAAERAEQPDWICCGLRSSLQQALVVG